MKRKKIKIFDTTLRDGEQAPGFSMDSNSKLKIAKQLEKLGVDIIEAGFPAILGDEFIAIEKISKEIKNTEICVLSRALKKDIDLAGKAVKEAKKSRIHIFIATSDIHLKYKLKKSKNEIKKIVRDSIIYATTIFDNITFSAEDATRSDKYFLLEILKIAIESGADTVGIADTVGFSNWEEYGALTNFIKKNIPKNITLSVHCHNDLGLAVANSLSGIKNGADEVQCTFGGIGERAGNASLEAIAMNILLKEKQYFTGIKFEEINKTKNVLEKNTDFKFPINQSIIGENVFKHESGIHQHGILKNKKTYEIFPPKLVGKVKHDIVIGKHSGQTGINFKKK